MTTQGRLVRVAGVLGAVWGAVLLARGDRLWAVVEGRQPSRGESRTVRLLGTRHLLQGLAEGIAPGRFRRFWSSVDLTHAASMVALAVLDPGRRRPVLVSAGVALVGAAATRQARRLEARNS
ncbi:hypothetical protein [Microlunatus ginsengisoli]|uniref:DUF4267 domain-containing protein n=1 Tax=Microlunatus ginsengisoli TaxID=363863 RepID=A0ABP6ZGN8_9ACTN